MATVSGCYGFRVRSRPKKLVHETVDACRACGRVTRGRVNPLLGRYVIRVGHNVTHRGMVNIANTTRAGDKISRLIMTSSHFISVHPICVEFKNKVIDELRGLFFVRKDNLKFCRVAFVPDNPSAVGFQK